MIGRGRRGLVGLLASVGVSQLGTSMSFLAVPWFVLSTTGSKTQTGLVTFAEMAPYVVAQATAGPLVDRLGARRTSVVTDLAAAVSMAIVPLLHALGALTLAALAVAVGLVGAARGGGAAARTVLLPSAGAAARLPIERTSGWYDGALRLAGLVGSPAAGVLIAFLSAGSVLAIDAGTFLFSACAVAATVPPSAGPAPAVGDSAPARGYAHSLREGFAYLASDRLLLGIAAMVVVTNFLDQAAGAVLVPVWARTIAHSSIALGVISGAVGAGALAGNAATTWLGPRLPRRTLFGWGFLLGGSPRFFVLAALGWVWPVVAVEFASGMGLGGINPVLAAVQYERVPTHLQARVIGACRASAWALIPFGSLAGAGLANALGLRPALAACGAAYLLATSAPFVFPSWRQMDDQAVTEVPGLGCEPPRRDSNV